MRGGLNYNYSGLCALIAACAFAYSIEPATAQVWTDDREALEDVANTVCDAYAMAAGEKAATAIATVAVFGLGVAAIAGLVTKAQAVMVAAAIAGVFGSFSIAQVITGRDRSCDELLASYTPPASPPVTNSQTNPMNQYPGGGTPPPSPCNEIDLGSLTLSGSEATINFTVPNEDNYRLEVTYSISSLSTGVDFTLDYAGNTTNSLFSGSGSRTITFPDDLLSAGSSSLVLEKFILANPVHFDSMVLRGSSC